MKSRSTIELLILLRNELIKINSRQFFLLGGLCAVVRLMLQERIICATELYKLDNYIEKNRPKYKLNRLYGWRPGFKPPRMRWLNKKINNNGKN